MNDSELGDLATQSYAAGRAATQAGDFPAAIQHLRSSGSAAAHFKTYELLGECLLAVNRPNDAIEYLAAAAGLGNRQFRSRYLLAQALLLVGEVDWATDKLTEALELQPTYRAARTLLDDISRSRGPTDSD